MPRKPKKPCKHPGCPKLTDGNYCEEHEALHRGERESAGKRGYNKKGRAVTATVVDHITPHRGNPILFWDEGNWQSLCKPCHDKKTWNEDANPVYHF